MSIASDLFRTVTVKIHDISQQLPYIVVNQADDNGKIIRFVPMDHGQKVTGFTGARLYYPPRSGDPYGDYVTGVESDGAWDFTIPVGVLSVGRVGCNLAFIDSDGETYSRNVVFLVEPAVTGVFDPEDGQQTRLDKIIGTVQDAADTAIETINETADNAVESINQTASDAVESIGKAEESISESVTAARESADAAANSEQQAAASASAAQTSERNAANSATQASQSAEAAKQSETNAAESERNAASSAEQAVNVVASVSGSVAQAEAAARSASQSSTAAAGSASAAGGSAQAAADSASKAGESATAAKASETNAAASASAAKVSETNAADSATAAQQAVDGFGLEVGTTTTGDTGTDAAVEIEKTGTKYTANFTIPRGDVGPAGVNENVPLGSTSGVVAQGTDAYQTLPRKVQVHGRTIENLCPVFNEANNNEVSFSTDSDGYITIKGTSSADIYAQHPIINFPANTKVWIYVDSDFKAKGITNVYAQSSGWAVYAKSNEVVSSTTPSATSGSLVISIASGVTVDTKIRVMFVASETEPDTSLFVPSGVNTVEPTKLVVAGKNLLQIRDDLSITEKNGVTFTPHTDKTVDINGRTTGLVDYYTVGRSWNNRATATLAKTKYVLSSNTHVNFYVRDFSLNTKIFSTNTVGGTVGIDLSTLGELNDEICYFALLNNTDYSGKHYMQLEYGDTGTDYETPNITVIDLPEGISLADGDTLTIDRDGTTRILHAEGEPTVLENVTLPELPAPTFNVYTTGGYVPPTVDVDYEQDVNLALDREIPHDATLVGNGTKSSPLGVGDLSSRYTPTTTTTALDTRVKALEAKPSGLASVTHDETLTGDGTSGSPLGLVDGNIINPINTDDAESVDPNKLYIVTSNTANIPSEGIRGNLYYSRVGSVYFQIIFGYSDLSSGPVIYMRKQWGNITGSQWVRFINEKDLSNYVPLATYQALEARVRALEAKLSDQ